MSTSPGGLIPQEGAPQPDEPQLVASGSTYEASSAGRGDAVRAGECAGPDGSTDRRENAVRAGGSCCSAEGAGAAGEGAEDDDGADEEDDEVDDEDDDVPLEPVLFDRAASTAPKRCSSASRR